MLGDGTAERIMPVKALREQKFICVRERSHYPVFLLVHGHGYISCGLSVLYIRDGVFVVALGMCVHSIIGHSS